jgi:hypothetical protein
MNTLPQLQIYKFNFIIQCLEDTKLPQYKGSLFRGVFGTAFKQATCISKLENCEHCLIKTSCTYFNIFESEIPVNNAWFLKGIKKTPHPFVIHPPLDTKRYFKKGELITFGVTIFGKYIKDFPYFVYAFIMAGKIGFSFKRSKFKLLFVDNITLNESIRIYNNTTGQLLTGYKEIDIDEFDNQIEDINTITLNFITPLRIQEMGLLTDKNKITPELIIRTIERRIFIVSALFCNNNAIDIKTPINDFIKISENNLYFYDLERFSNRQNTKIPLGGFKGTLSLTGNIKSFYPLIKLGSLINIGKNTVFGLGSYEIIVH